MRRILSGFMVFSCLGLLAACTPIGTVIGGAAIAGSTALQQRGFQQALNDKATELTIQKKVIDQDFETFQRLDVVVVEGRVLLTGIVPTAEDRIQVIKSVWQNDGVLEVINEVTLGADVGTVETGYDLKIEKALELALTLDRNVKMVNYIMSASAGTLYLIGIAQNQAELDRVLAHAREAERVRRVVSHVQLKGSPERAALLERLAVLNSEKAQPE